MKNIKNIFLGAIVLFASVAQAQLTTPQPSPTATISQKVGLTDVEVTYSRPGAKGRTVFGDVVPFDKLWRTGANMATTINFGTDVTFGGKEVKAGKYALFTIPGKTEWIVILNSKVNQSGTGSYDEADDVARITLKPTALKDAVETFTIDFSHLEGANGHMSLTWENTKVTVLIETAANEMVEKQIKEILVDGPGAGTYANAARFYLANDKDMEQALKWINLAIEKRPDAFWYVYNKAQILQKMGKTKEAIATAEASKKMAQENEGGDYGYVANNEKLIAELKK